MSVDVYIGAGSNRGDRFGHLRSAWTSIQDVFTQTGHSSLWETAPLIIEDQPEFFNMVFYGVFGGNALELLDEMQRIEAENGRDRSQEIPKGPRTLDLDILLFGDDSFSTKILMIPHPEIRKRSFVLTPLLEVYPENGPYAEAFRQSLLILGNQEIICRRNKEESNFWEAF